MPTDLYEMLKKLQAARDGGLRITLDDLLGVANKDTFITLDDLYDRAVDRATRRQSYVDSRGERFW